MIVKKGNSKKLIDGLEKITSEDIKEDIAENGIEAIIKRELYNHEALYTGDLEDTILNLEDYWITAEQVVSVYHEELNNEQVH